MYMILGMLQPCSCIIQDPERPCVVWEVYAVHVALFITLSLSTGFHIAASKTLPRNNAGWLETKRVNLHNVS